MSRIPFISVLVVLSIACSGEPFQAELAECRCETEGCGPDDCAIRVVIDANCTTDIAFAEVWVDGHIEAELAVPGTPLTTCSRIPLNGAVQVAVRGGGWIWGPLTESCVEARATRDLLLQCAEAAEE